MEMNVVDPADAKSVEITLASVRDEPELMPLMEAFNRAEGIAWQPRTIHPALGRLLRKRDVGLILIGRHRESGHAVGYALATFGFDLEFAGRDAFITELFVEPAQRGRGLGRTLLDAMVETLRLCEANAVHLMVRAENARAKALYEGRGFQAAPRIMMTKVFRPVE